MNTPIKFTTAEEAVKVIKSGDHVHLSSVASAPQCLIKAMCARGEAGELKNVHVHHLHTEGPAPYADPKFEGVFQLDSLFVGANVRKVTQSGYADYIPIFLSETQKQDYPLMSTIWTNYRKVTAKKHSTPTKWTASNRAPTAY